jgi:hypothetical protein
LFAGLSEFAWRMWNYALISRMDLLSTPALGARTLRLAPAMTDNSHPSFRVHPFRVKKSPPL